MIDITKKTTDPKVKASHLRFVLRSRSVMQLLRQDITTEIQNNKETLQQQEKLKFHLKKTIDAVNHLMEDNKDQSALSKDEVQVAVNTVLSVSKPPIEGWNGSNPFITIPLSDVRRHIKYIKSIDYLASEKVYFDIPEKANDDEFNVYI